MQTLVKTTVLTELNNLKYFKANLQYFKKTPRFNLLQCTIFPPPFTGEMLH